MKEVGPVLVVELFPEERRLLLQLFSELSETDWNKPTACEGWSVRDIGLHLLGDDMGYLSRKRDNFKDVREQSNRVTDWQSLVRAVNSMNSGWVTATRRISPRMLHDLLSLTGQQFYEYIGSLDQMRIAGSVSWAGPDPAPVWLDTAREYTERWLHQQQIREAVNKPGLKEYRLFSPVIDTFMRALPHTYREVLSPNRTVVKAVVTGDSGGVWYLLRQERKWLLCTEVDVLPSATVTIDQETCWKLFTKGINKEDVRQKVSVEGDTVLGEKVLDTVSIIA